MKTPENTTISGQDSASLRDSFEKKAHEIFYPVNNTKGKDVELDSKYTVSADKSPNEKGITEKAGKILASLEGTKNNSNKDTEGNKTSSLVGAHTASSHHHAHPGKNGFRKFFSTFNLKKIIGIGAVVAGSLASTSTADDNAKTEKYSDSRTIEQAYKVPNNDAAYNKFMHQVQQNINNKLAAELKASGFDYIKIVPDQDSMGHPSEEGTVFFKNMKKATHPLLLTKKILVLV